VGDFVILYFKSIGWQLEGKKYAAAGGDPALPVVMLW